MKYILALLFTFSGISFAEAKCQPTNARARLVHGNTVTIYFLVMKNSDCIFQSNWYNFEKGEVISQPKNGKAGINVEAQRIIYVPKEGFIGEDIATYRGYYKNDKGELGSSIVNIVYTVM